MFCLKITLKAKIKAEIDGQAKEVNGLPRVVDKQAAASHRQGADTTFLVPRRYHRDSPPLRVYHLVFEVQEVRFTRENRRHARREPRGTGAGEKP